MYTLLIFLFVFVAILMTVTILMQSSKGGGLAASFGGAGMGGVLGPRGAANFLQKATTVLAILYGLLCLIIGFIGRPMEERSSIIQQQMQQEQAAPPSTLPIAPMEGMEQQQVPPAEQPATGQEQQQPAPEQPE
ncbi:MAG: preprotein translocase subunit SecG [Calditrichaeota bacterium]|nr:preprotein translocase subunit SecG [Calditrichota bacterium]